MTPNQTWTLGDLKVTHLYKLIFDAPLSMLIFNDELVRLCELRVSMCILIIATYCLEKSSFYKKIGARLLGPTNLRDSLRIFETWLSGWG